METDRTRDSIEQLEDTELPNPITDETASLGEAGDALNPQGEAPKDPRRTRPRCRADRRKSRRRIARIGTMAG